VRSFGVSFSRRERSRLVVVTIHGRLGQAIAGPEQQFDLTLVRRIA
jgi:hypothetical protein